MKVIHINTFASGGAAIAAFRLHHALLNIGVSSNVLVARKPKLQTKAVIQAFPKQHSFFIQKLYNRQVIKPNSVANKEKEKNLIGSYEIFTFATSDYRLEDHPLVKEADIIHLHWVANFINYPTFFKKIKKPIVWTLHDMNPFLGGFHYFGDRERNPRLKEFDDKEQFIKMKALSKYKGINFVSPSMWMYHTATQFLSAKHYNHHLIRNCVEAPYKIENLNRNDVRTSLGITREHIVLTFACDTVCVYRKGFDILQKALKGIRSNIKIIAIGCIKKPDEELDVHFTGYLNKNELNAYLLASDAFLLPSREDNLPNVMLESLVLGTPVISFSNGGMPEIIKPGFNGELAEDTTSKAFIESIGHFISNIKKYNREQIAAEARTLFNAKAIGDKHIQLYKKLMHSN